MNMDEIMAGMKELADGGMEQLQASSQQTFAALIVSIVVGLAICLFGLKLVRVLAALAGFLLGAAIGVPVAGLTGLTGLGYICVILACGVVLAIVGGIFYKFGIFIWVFIGGAVLAAVFIQPETLLMGGICFAIGLVLAILTAIFMEPLLIIFTSINGGIAAGNALMAITGLTGNIWIVVGVCAALAVIGMIVQFMMRSRQIGKAERVYSSKYREEASREAEVEKARNMLFEDEEEEESEDDDDDIRFVD